jgi:hypothetical protein
MAPSGVRLFDGDSDGSKRPFTSHITHPNLIIMTIRAEIWSVLVQGEPGE